MTSGGSDEGEVGLLKVGHEAVVLLGDAELDPAVAFVETSDLLPIPPPTNDFFMG